MMASHTFYLAHSTSSTMAGTKRAARCQSSCSCDLWVGDDVHLRTLRTLRTFILQLSQEKGQEVFDGVVFAQNGREAHDD